METEDTVKWNREVRHQSGNEIWKSRSWAVHVARLPRSLIKDSWCKGLLPFRWCLPKRYQWVTWFRVSYYFLVPDEATTSWSSGFILIPGYIELSSSTEAFFHLTLPALILHLSIRMNYNAPGENGCVPSWDVYRLIIREVNSISPGQSGLCWIDWLDLIFDSSL